MVYLFEKHYGKQLSKIYPFPACLSKPELRNGVHTVGILYQLL